MIIFEKVKYKNFLSSGNNFIEVDLNSASTTLIVGSNGAGKTTMIEAISFSLFGKPYRNISKPQLVNTVNNKDTVVELEFRIGKNHYRVKRGIKPNLFEIYQNNKMISQSSNVRDYQKHLESNILKLNHKSFHQIVVLGSSSFVPFMELPKAARREVIEDLLDIQIFSKMNIVVKEKISNLRQKIKDIEASLEIIREKNKLQKKFIVDLTEMNNEYIEQRKAMIKKNSEEILMLQRENDSNQEWIDKESKSVYQDIEEYTSKRNDADSNRKSLLSRIKAVVKNAKFYDVNDFCPTCTQPIAEEVKKEKISQLKTEAAEVQSELKKTENDLKDFDDMLSQLKKLSEETRFRNQKISANNASIKQLNKQNASIENEINDITSVRSDIDRAHEEMSDLNEQYNQTLTMKDETIESLNYSEAMSEMLKDKGIKTKIISEYIPVMNSMVNKYLQMLDFFVSFHLDENFEEKIKSRHRDEFSYGSFSEGEKQRINLALMMTWRQIAKLKNSAATNLLIMDEVMDSSIDIEGIDGLQEILSVMKEDSNIFIISHRNELKDKSIFDSTITFKKEQNFSCIERVYHTGGVEST